mmetsp:Transcript_11887/g.15498  ORF Transcript_11887/g.15498 Transcript_11887/m.15498 type:complete len:243 (-) Transcript_11887:186-914(-)
MILIHMICNMTSKCRDGIRFGVCVFLSCYRTSSCKSTNKSYIHYGHSKEIEVTKIHPKGTGMLLQICFSCSFKFFFREQSCLSHKIHSTVSSSFEIFTSNSQTASWILQYVLGVTAHTTEREQRSTFIIRGKSYNTTTRKPRISLGIRAHDCKPMIVLNKRTHISWKSKFRGSRLMFHKTFLNLPFLFINFNLNTIIAYTMTCLFRRSCFVLFRYLIHVGGKEPRRYRIRWICNGLSRSDQR